MTRLSFGLNGRPNGPRGNRYATPPERKTAAVPQQAAPVSSGELTVLYVAEEDEPESLWLQTIKSIESEQCHLVIASRLANALQIFKRSQVDAIVLETRSLNDAGFARLDYVLAWQAACPIMVLTEHADTKAASRAFAAGIDECWSRADMRPMRLGAVIRNMVLKFKASGSVQRTRKMVDTGAPLQIVQEADDGFVIVDREGIVRFVNDSAARVFGRGADQLLGRPFPFSLSGSGRQEIAIEQEDGDDAIVDMRVIDTDWGGYPARLVSLQDITMRSRLETALGELKKMRGQCDDLVADLRREIEETLLPALATATTSEAGDNMQQARAAISRAYEFVLKRIDVPEHPDNTSH